MYLIFFFVLLYFFWGAVNAELTSVESADVWEAKFVRVEDAIPEIPNQPAAPDSSFFHIRLGGSAVKMFTIAALWGFSSSECLTKENVEIFLSSSKSDFVAGDNPSNLITMKFSVLSVLSPSKIENLSQNDQSSLFKENGYYMQVTSFIPEETILLRVEQYPSFHPEAHGICIQKFYYGITTLRDNRNFPETLFSAKFKKAVFRYSKSDGVFLTIGGISNPNSLVTYTLFDSNMDSIDQLSESVAVGLKRLIIEKESRLQLTLIIELHDTTLRHEIVYDHEAFQNNNEKTLEIIKLPPPNEVKRVEMHLGFSLCLGCRVQSVIACFKCNVDTNSKNDYAEFSSLKDHITTERINESLMKFDKLPFNKEYRNLAFSAENSAMNPSFEPKIQSQGFNIDSTKVFLTNKRIEEEESDESDTSFEYSSDFISENLLLRLPDVKSLNSGKLKHNNHLITYVFISLSYFAALFLIFWVWYYFRISQRIPMIDHSPLVEINHAITESDEELISLESLSNSLSSNSILD